jgi:hypothetical protein
MCKEIVSGSEHILNLKHISRNVIAPQRVKTDRNKDFRFSVSDIELLT